MRPSAITSFQGDCRWLSNFWPVGVEFEGLTFSSVEHAYQAAKTTHIDERRRFLGITPGQARRLGKQVTQRAEWEAIKLGVMRILVMKKFEQPELRRKLLATGDIELVEGNHWGDTFWGVYNGNGTNHLGLILMEVRQAARRDREDIT